MRLRYRLLAEGYVALCALEFRVRLSFIRLEVECTAVLGLRRDVAHRTI